MSCDGLVVEHQLEPKAGAATAATIVGQTVGGKKVDDSPLELATAPLTQWNLQRYADVSNICPAASSKRCSCRQKHFQRIKFHEI